MEFGFPVTGDLVKDKPRAYLAIHLAGPAATAKADACTWRTIEILGASDGDLDNAWTAACYATPLLGTGHEGEVPQERLSRYEQRGKTIARGLGTC